MKVAFQKEDIELLASILQEQLLLEVPSGEVFQVRCAVQNDELMILTQHPQNVIVDTQEVFAVLEEAFQWQYQYHHQRVQFYVRVSGEKLPYAKHSIIVEAKGIHQDQEIPRGEESDSADLSLGSNNLIFPPLHLPNSPSPGNDDYISSDTSFSSANDDHISSDTSFSSVTHDYISSDTSFSSVTHDYLSSNNAFSSAAHDYISSDSSFSSDNLFIHENENELPEGEKFDPFADGENLSKTKKRTKGSGFGVSLPSLPILLGAVLGVSVIFGVGAFFLTRSCVIGSCPELQNAEQFKKESEQLMRRSKSEQDLLAVQQQLDTVVSSLKVIPQFSPRYQQAQELTLGFSDQSAKINQVVKALQAASVAEQKTKTPASSREELRTRQGLWRQAIAPLESIKPGNQLYGLVQANLPTYQRNLQVVNQQLLNEETWQKKLDTAKTIADSALKRETTAKSGNDWQRVQLAWQEAVNGLKSIPQASTGYKEAQNLLTDYQPKFILASDRAKKEIAATKIYQQAVNMATQAKVYEQKNQWQAAVGSWQQALQRVKQISQDSFYYNQAQSLIPPYSTALAQAQEKQKLYGNLAQTRADLNTTCVNGTRFCTFAIDSKGISVRLTLDYDQRLQSGKADIQNHFQTLQQALGVISDNANLPVFLYNSQGQERYMKMPQ